MIKDCLQDLVDHTHALGNIQFVKIMGDKKTTKFFTMAEDSSVVIEGEFKKPIAEFLGVFGIPNIAKLSIILSIPEYDENANITIEQQGKGDGQIPVCLHFENEAGDFRNDYRFMSTELINQKLKNLKWKGGEWDISVAPSVNSITRLKFQSQANSEETLFTAKTEGKNLMFKMGDASSYAGDFVFEQNVKGSLKAFQWPVAPTLCILNLTGDKEMKFNNQGALLLVVDSGLAEYRYILPSQTK